MLKRLNIITTAILILTAALSASGKNLVESINPFEKFAKGEKILLDSASVNDPSLHERVIVGEDTVSIIIPQKNYGRYDRGLFNFLFVRDRKSVV